MMPQWEVRWRLHPQDKPPVFAPFHDPVQGNALKPEGLWFTPTEADWVDWCAEQSPGWLEGMTLSRVEVDVSRLLRLTTVEEVMDFSRRFGTSLLPSLRMHHIDWSTVAVEHDGIEIAPYQWELRLDVDHFWYYGWDVASGCIWRGRSVRTWNKNRTER